MAETKTCKDCLKELPRSEFYGVQGECKTCTKKRVNARRLLLEKTNPEWVEKELARHREKSRKARSDGKASPIKPETRAKYNATHQNQRAARTITGNAIRDGRLIKQPCCVCGSDESEAHHEDYAKPLEVIWYCTKHHAERHVEINRARRRGAEPSPPF